MLSLCLAAEYSSTINLIQVQESAQNWQDEAQTTLIMSKGSRLTRSYMRRHGDPAHNGMFVVLAEVVVLCRVVTFCMGLNSHKIDHLGRNDIL